MNTEYPLLIALCDRFNTTVESASLSDLSCDFLGTRPSLQTTFTDSIKLVTKFTPASIYWFSEDLLKLKPQEIKAGLMLGLIKDENPESDKLMVLLSYLHQE